MRLEVAGVPARLSHTLSEFGYLDESPTHRFNRYYQRTAEVDLSHVCRKVMHPNPNIGYGWSAEFTERLVAEYRIFFAMHAAFPKVALPPSRVMDLFWHEHILDTRAYFADCDYVAGHYIHHMPYFGMRNAADAELVVAALQLEHDLYVSCVGREPPHDLWIVGFTVERMQALVAGRYTDPDATEIALADASAAVGSPVQSTPPEVPELPAQLRQAAAAAAALMVADDVADN